MLLVLPFFKKKKKNLAYILSVTAVLPHQTTIAADGVKKFLLLQPQCDLKRGNKSNLRKEKDKVCRREGSDKTTKCHPAAGEAQQPAVAAAGCQQQQQQQPAGLLQQRPEQSGRLAAGVRGDGQVRRRSVF